MTLEQSYTTAQVAEAMACSTDTVLRLAQKGVLESFFWGHDRRYTESAIARYKARSAKKANAPSADVIALAERREKTA